MTPIPDKVTAKEMQSELRSLTAKFYRRHDKFVRTGVQEYLNECDEIRQEMRVIEDALDAWEKETLRGSNNA